MYKKGFLGLHAHVVFISYSTVKSEKLKSWLEDVVVEEDYLLQQPLVPNYIIYTPRLLTTDFNKVSFSSSAKCVFYDVFS